MLTDPQTVTISGTPVSLARKSMPGFPGRGDKGMSTDYGTADLSTRLRVEQHKTREGHRYVEIYLARKTSEPDGNTANNRNVHGTWNAVGLTFVQNTERIDESGLSDLRSALSSLVDSGLLTRLLGGES